MNLLWHCGIMSLLAGLVKAQLGTSDRAVCDCYPDPHFRTWDNIYYDYQGGADLILCKGNVVDVHIRTQALQYYARILRAAVHIHSTNTTLEVQVNGTCCLKEPCDCPRGGGTNPGGRHRQLSGASTYLVNGITPPTTPATVGPYPFSITTSPSEEYTLDLGIAQSIKIDVYGGSLRVLMDLHGSVAYTCKGMCGDWATGALHNRDGSPYIVGSSRRIRRLSNTINSAFGEEWAVGPSDPQYFTEPGIPVVYPEVPSGNDQLQKQAQDACKPAMENGKEVFLACVFDVMATGNLEWATAPRYLEPEPQPPQTDPVCRPINTRCEKLGGKCMYKCDRKKYRCQSGLCRKRRGVKYNGKPIRGWKACSCALPIKNPAGRLV